LIEHLDSPEKLIQEIKRITKPQGMLYLVAPFILGFHSSPNDYYRWTDQGLIKLLRDFFEVKIEIIYGPTTAFTQVLSEWLAILFSFNSKTMHNILFITFMTIFTPIKYLDYLIGNFSSAKNIALGFLATAKKND
jgi:SAM-dependent methyltransferase